MSKELELAAIQNAHEAQLQAVKKSAALYKKTIDAEKAQLIDERFPDIARERALFDYQLQVAEKLTLGGALPRGETKEMAFVKIKAGAEIGLNPFAAIQAFAFIHGRLMLWGKAMGALITSKGYRLEYHEESPQSVTVRCFLPDLSFDIREKVFANDPVIRPKKSKTGAMVGGIVVAPINKLRFHAIRRILDFHLPHLVADCDAGGMAFAKYEEIQAEEIQAEDPKKKRISVFIATANAENLVDAKEEAYAIGLGEEYELRLSELAG